MTLQQQKLVNELLNLSTEGQLQVAEFVAKLNQEQQPAPSGNADLSQDPFVGMWRDRDDLSDSSDWVRNVRRSE